MKILHITDLDGTIIPLMEAGKPYSDPKPYAARYTDFINKNNELSFAYCTGRSIAALTGLIRDYGLPVPEISICSGGSEIYRMEDLSPVKEWHDIMRSTGFDAGVIRRLLDLPALPIKPLPEISHSEFKTGYRLAQEANVSKTLAEIREIITGAPFLVKMIYMAGNRILHILPKPADKGSALKFLSSHLGIPMENIVISGDQENDIDMFEQDVGFKIAPSNADKFILDYFKQQHIDVYIARSDCSDGIIEGLKVFMEMRGAGT